MALSLPGFARKLLPQRLTEELRRLVWSLPNLRRELPSGLVATVASPSDWLLYNDIFVDGEYDPAIDLALELALASRRGAHGSDTPDAPLRILDLGANVGYFSLRAADRLATAAPGTPLRFVLVEPSPVLAGELKRRLLSQPALAGAVTLHNALVGRREGMGVLFESPLHFENSLVARQGVRRREVPYVDLDSVLGPEVKIDLLKCDIEGSELEFLGAYPALLRRTRVCVIELHPEKCDSTACLRLLEEAGFNQRRILRQGDAWTVALLWKTDISQS
jgi:FkbM family methyltransferase